MAIPDADLTLLLGRLEAAWAVFPDHRLTHTALPGVARSQVFAAFDSIGLVPPTEVVDWFGWHNGASVGLTAHRLPGIGDWALLSLEEAVAQARMLRRVDKDVWAPGFRYWLESWFPLMHDGGGNYLFLDVARSDGLVPVLNKLRDDGTEGAQELSVSLRDFVHYWLLQIESGEWVFRQLDSYEPGGGMWCSPNE